MQVIRCSDCANIGDKRKWGMPDGELPCKAIRDRQAAYDASPRVLQAEPIDRFRFRPTDGVLPYQYADKCRFFTSKIAIADVTNGASLK